MDSYHRPVTVKYVFCVLWINIPNCYITPWYVIHEFPLLAVLGKTIAPGRNHFDNSLVLVRSSKLPCYVFCICLISEIQISWVGRSTRSGQTHNVFQNKNNFAVLMSWAEKKAETEAKLGLVKVRGQNNPYIFLPLPMNGSGWISANIPGDGIGNPILNNTSHLNLITMSEKRRSAPWTLKSMAFPRGGEGEGQDIKTDIPNCQHCSNLKKVSF